MRWRNVPIPEGHVTFLLLGLGLQVLSPQPVLPSRWPRGAFGWPLLLLGLLGAGWATAAAQQVDLSRPTALVVSGPYCYSRNPMYVAWTLIYLAAAVLANTRWLLLGLPLLLAHLRSRVIPREEQALEAAFGEAYRRYRAGVPRYW
jgi:protein-S-isoprenylcysteine O-methyltransferase Ste14